MMPKKRECPESLTFKITNKEYLLYKQALREGGYAHNEFFSKACVALVQKLKQKKKGVMKKEKQIEKERSLDEFDRIIQKTVRSLSQK